MEAITTKAQMYRLLASGQLGNTIAQHFDVGAWERSEDFAKYKWWGVRTLRPGGPCRLNCPREEVRATAAAFGEKVNVSQMIDRTHRVTLWADVVDTDTGLAVYGIEHPPRGASWRALMPSQGKQWEGLAARHVLRRHLNAASLADLYELLERFPRHVVELSATTTPVGMMPGRCYCVWEIRKF